MPSLQTALSSPQVLLAALILAPFLITWLFGLFPGRTTSEDGLLSASPIAFDAQIDTADPVLRPASHQLRALTAPELHSLAIGLRHAPVEAAAPLLHRLADSADPELTLYAQSILQQGREKLHAALLPAQTAARHGSTRAAAAHLEIALRLASPTLVSTSERATMLTHLSATATTYLSAHEPTARLVTAAARIFIAARSPEKAIALADTLPHGSPLHVEIVRASRFALHQKQVTA